MNIRKKERIKSALLALVFLSGSAAASTWDEIASLDAAKTAGQTPTGTEKAAIAAKSSEPARWMPLSSGQHVNLTDWRLVVFMSSTCSYCHAFDPILRQVSDASGLKLMGYTIDGKGDATFPEPFDATPDVMAQFFGQGIPVATPTTFLVNVNTMATYPLWQGSTDARTFMGRMDEVFQIALRGGAR